jgi:transcriptional antiterminator RfaH
MIDWYAVHAKSHNEARVLRYLTQKAVSAFLPFIEVIRRYRYRCVRRLEPLFPGYLFVQMERMGCNPDRWHTVRWAPGVKAILGTGDAPIPLPDTVIDAIKTRMQDLGFVRPALGFDPNARVLIKRGPLAGLEAIFEKPLSRSRRVRVLMDLLGQQRRVHVDAIDLELA